MIRDWLMKWFEHADQTNRAERTHELAADTVRRHDFRNELQVKRTHLDALKLDLNRFIAEHQARYGIDLSTPDPTADDRGDSAAGHGRA